MSKMRDGPAKNAVKQKALRVLKQKKQYEVIILVKILFIHTTQNSQNKQTKISDHETNIFELKVGVKSGLDFFILKSYQPLQSCCCPVQKVLPRRAELAWQVSRYFKIKNLDHFSPSFLSQKLLSHDLRFQSTYYSHSRVLPTGEVC